MFVNCFAFDVMPIEAFQRTYTILLDGMYIVPLLYSPLQTKTRAVYYTHPTLCLVLRPKPGPSLLAFQR